jgi:hypothetical protein
LNVHWTFRKFSDLSMTKIEFSFNISESKWFFHQTIWMFFEHLGKSVICPWNKLDVHWTFRKFSDLSMRQFACSLNIEGVK